MSSPAQQKHQQELRAAIEAATGKSGAHLHGYLGGYCDNPDCDVRGVLIRMKGHYGSVKEMRCPACRGLLLLGDHAHRVTAMTESDYGKLTDARARANVRMQLRRVVGRWHFNGTEFYTDLTLKELGEAFRVSGSSLRGQR